MAGVRGKAAANKFGAAVATPLYQGHPALEFDDTRPEDLHALTPKQQVDVFASKWQRVMDPFERYKTYLRPDVPNSRGPSIVRQVKNQYKRCCVTGDWDDRKFVMIVDYMLLRQMMPSASNVDRVGMMYDLNSLPYQSELVGDTGVKATGDSSDSISTPKRRRRL